MNNIRRNIKEIHQLDPNGKLVATYDSVKNAALTIGINKSCITNIFYGFNQTAAGYQWEVVYCQPSENKQARKKENPSRLSEKEEREIDEFLEQVNGGTRERLCVGIDSNGNLCNKKFMSKGNYQRKCPKCQTQPSDFLHYKAFITNNNHFYSNLL